MNNEKIDPCVLGSFLMACDSYEKTHTEKQEQKILGSVVFRKNDFGKWFYDLETIAYLGNDWLKVKTEQLKV